MDTLPDIAYSLNESLRILGLSEYELSEIRSYVGSGITPLMEKRATGLILEKLKKSFSELYSGNICNRSSLYNGWDLVFNVTPKSTRVVLSNKPEFFLRPLIAGLNLGENFEGFFGREAFSERKPSPLPIIKIMEKYKVKSSETVIVGDMPDDIQSGKSAGITTIGALYGYGTRESFNHYPPDFFVQSPSELLEIPGIRDK